MSTKEEAQSDALTDEFHADTGYDWTDPAGDDVRKVWLAGRASALALPLSAELVTGPSDAEAILSKVCDLFHIGQLARTESTILTNVGTVLRLTKLLQAVERDLFAAPELPEDDDPYGEFDEGLPVPNSWGAKDEADYVAQFRAAILARFGLPPVAATAAWLNEADQNDLERLDDLFDDGEGWDLPKERMKRLADLGVIASGGFGRYSITSFGRLCLGSTFSRRPLETVDECNERLGREHRAALHAEKGADRG